MIPRSKLRLGEGSKMKRYTCLMMRISNIQVLTSIKVYLIFHAMIFSETKKRKLDDTMVEATSK